MIEKLAENLVNLKKEFALNYEGTSQIQEIIPISKSELFPIDQDKLNLLHEFATKNPIYYNSFEKIINDISCIVYEGDINKYWLNSIQHNSSHAPFSPTWIMSGYVLSLFAKENGYSEIIDIGSGDGRIAYCAKALVMESYSIELDNMLVDLQKSLTDNINFNPNCSDAVQFDYSSLNLKKPLFFIGGLAQMGGLELATGVLNKIKPDSNLWNNVGWCLLELYQKNTLQIQKIRLDGVVLLKIIPFNPFKIFRYQLLGRFMNLMKHDIFLQNHFE